jgi:hypothetical protein
MKTKLLVKVASAALALSFAGCNNEDEKVALTAIEVTPAQDN